jgi:hypothetical protein
MISQIGSLALLLTAVACASLAGGLVWELIDQPWNDVDEQIFADGTYLTIFSGLTALFTSAAAVLLALFVRRMRAAAH